MGECECRRLHSGGHLSWTSKDEFVGHSWGSIRGRGGVCMEERDERHVVGPGQLGAASWGSVPAGGNVQFVEGFWSG